MSILEKLHFEEFCNSIENLQNVISPKYSKSVHRILVILYIFIKKFNRNHQEQWGISGNGFILIKKFSTILDVFDLKNVENSKIHLFLNYFLLIHNDTQKVLFPSFKPIESGWILPSLSKSPHFGLRHKWLCSNPGFGLRAKYLMVRCAPG